MRLPVAFAIGAVLALAASCGDCVGVGLSRLSETERTIAVGQSFVVTYQEGSSCSNTFAPVSGRARWRSSDTTIAVVDSATGRVTGKRIGDATVDPGTNDPPLSLVVHVR